MAADPDHHHNSLLSFLTKGSQVEVTSDDDGFAGAWFVATVIRPPSTTSKTRNSHRNLVYVEYHNLLSEEASSKRLREYADVSFVRPSPPRPDTRTDFELNDVVDAFYRDGWWTGVITRVVNRSNFVVAFQNPPGKIQFHISDLRVLQKWVAGGWIRPEKQRTEGTMFSVGKKVEVSFERQDLSGVWFPASVLEDSGNASFVVEYRSPGTDNEAKLHKVTVDHAHIRPAPPDLRDKDFDLLEKVDAYFDFGWWGGVITKELADSRYIVFFKHTNKQREFSHSELRPRMQWKDGQWFSFSQGTVVCGESNSVKGDTERRETRSSTDKQIEQTNLGIDKQSSAPESTMKRKNQNLDNNNKHSSLPSKKSKDGIMGSHVTPSKGKNPDEAIVSEQSFGKTENLSHGKKVRSKRGKDVEPNNTQMMDSARKKGKQTTDLRSPKALPEGVTGVSAEKTTEDKKKELTTHDFPTPIVLSLQCNAMRISKGKLQPVPSEKTPNVGKDQTPQSGVPTSPVTAVNLEGRESNPETIAPKRKRGRPPKLQATSPEASVTVNPQNGDSAVMEGNGTNNGGEGTESVKEGLVPEKEQLNLTKKTPPPKQKNTSKKDNGSGQALNAEEGKHASVKGKRGKRRMKSINTDSSAQDSQDVSKEKGDGRVLKDSTRNDGEKSLDTVSDDQPLSKWFEGRHSPTPVDGAGAAQEVTVEQPTQTEPETVKSPPPASGNGENFSFVRNTPLWETLKSMEVFRTIPQNPHFRPLDGVKESAREGLALGSMVTFSTVVGNTSKLTLDHPRTAIEESLETLVELENYGFDVKLIRDRLTALLLVKDKQEELEETLKGIGEKMEEHKAEAMAMEEELEELNRKIRELQEKRAQVVSKKEKRGPEMEALKVAADEVSKGMSEARLEFDGLAAAPW